MNDCINREAAKEAAWKNIINRVVEEQGMYGYLCNLVNEVFDAIPAADVRPVVRGKWVNNHCSVCEMMPMGEEIWECCDFAPLKFEWFMNFCPNCGADMRGKPD